MKWLSVLYSVDYVDATLFCYYNQLMVCYCGYLTPIITYICTMTQRINKSLVLLYLLFTAIGCNNVDLKLKHAESIIQEKPDSALSILESIDTVCLISNRQKADYALLHTMALDKNYIDVTDLKILEPAIAYYFRHGSYDRKAMVKYYEGIVNYRGKRYGDATVSLFDAMRLAESTQDNWLKGKICSTLASLYNKNYNKEDELAYCELAYDYFSALGDSLYIVDAIRNKAVALHNNERFSEADSLYSLVPRHNKYYPSSLLLKADNEIKRPDRNPDKARKLFEAAYKMGEPFTAEQYYLYAYSLVLTGDSQNADGILESINHLSKTPVEEWWLYMIRKREGLVGDAFRHLENYTYVQDSIVRTKLAQSLYKAESEHQLFLAEKVSGERKQVVILFVSSVLVSVIMLLLIIIGSQNKTLKLNRKYSVLMSKYVDSQRVINNLKACQNNQFASFVAMYKQRMSGIGDLYNKTVSLQCLLGDADVVFQNEAREILDAVTRPKEFEARVDADMNGIMKKLRSDFPKFDEETFRLLSFVVVGFKDRTIASIMKINTGTIRSRKSRTKRQILSSKSLNHWLYETLL